MGQKKLALKTEFSDVLRRHSRLLELLRQNELLVESSFLLFASELGIGVKGVIKGEPSEFHRRDGLSADGKVGGQLAFHPFRVYVLHEILSAHGRDIASIAPIWNEIVDLAILLEPIYWPDIVESTRLQVSEARRPHLIAKHWKLMSELIRNCDPVVWEKRHADLRTTAGWLDQNSELYLLLRVAPWKQREAIRGRIGAALWIRHLAEVIRRGFEEVHNVAWLEEDRAFGRWPKGARARKYGAERPLDDLLAAKWKIAYLYGLSNRSAVRWYVEGETEHEAIRHVVTEMGGNDPAKLGIAFVDLHGEIAPQKGNLALRLRQSLKEDIEAKRFSQLTFDLDVGQNRQFVNKLVQDDLIVGRIDASSPDFEFANFTLDELVEIAARLDDSLGFPGDHLRQHAPIDIKRAKAFEDWYKTTSERRRPIKGKTWGRALASYALEFPRWSNEDRPLIHAAFAAVWGWQSNYDRQRRDFTFERDRFRPVARKPG